MKQQEENIREVLQYVGIGNDFRNITPKAQEIKARTDKWGHIQIQSFCTAK
jgi:hypothetical protein